MEEMPHDAALGIMAYNEERNIARLLDSVLQQSALDRIASIVVVASGCTDDTCAIVEDYARAHPRISLIAETDRGGKIAAINKFLLAAKQELLMVSSADLIYDQHAVEHLLAPFDDPEVGMVGAHSIPLDSPDTFFGHTVNLMWSMHHEISLRDPKMGELIAFRNVFRRINPGIVSDELMVHEMVRAGGYRTVYAPDAIVYNKGPENIHDFVGQRMRCIIGNLQIMREHNIPVSTMSFMPVIRAGAPLALRRWKRLHWTAAAALLELFCRVRSRMLYHSRKGPKSYRVWEQLSTTKKLA